MNDVQELVSAMLAIVLAAVMLVVGQLYLENGSTHLPMSQTAQMASVP
jgi:hypothetical protein